MDKDRLDSLATVAVGSEKISPVLSHYAPSEVYSASESSPPPAYARGTSGGSAAVEIVRTIAGTMIAISVIIGCFILASAWLQARASCSPESVAATMAHQARTDRRYNNDFGGQLPPQSEALVQEHSLADEARTDMNRSEDKAGTTDAAISNNSNNNNSNHNNDENDNSNGDVDDNVNNNDEYDRDYSDDDTDLPPVRIKLPLRLDLDDLAGNLLDQARSVVSCVVESRRSDEVTDDDTGVGEKGDERGSKGNTTERQRLRKLSGEQVAVLCESGDPRRKQPEREMPTPMIVPLGAVRIPYVEERRNEGYAATRIGGLPFTMEAFASEFPGQGGSMNEVQDGATIPIPRRQPIAQGQLLHEPRIATVEQIPVAPSQQRPVNPSGGIPDDLDNFFRGIPVEIGRMIRRFPFDIDDAIRRVTTNGGDAGGVEERPLPVSILRLESSPPRDERVQESMQTFAVPVQARIQMERNNNGEQRDEEERNEEMLGGGLPGMPGIPANLVVDAIEQIRSVVEGRALPVQDFVTAAKVSNNDRATIVDNTVNRPHFVQPRSVRSVPEEGIAHPREKRVRRCACDCAC